MAARIDAQRYIVIERVSPELDCGRYAVKREVGDRLEVSADIFKEGHDVIAAAVRYRAEDEESWSEAPLRFVDNDRWGGSFALQRNCRYYFTIAAWTDWFGSWQSDLRKKYEARQEVGSELLEGERLLAAAAGRATAADRARLTRFRAALVDTDAAEGGRVDLALSDELRELMDRYPDRRDLTHYEPTLSVQVDRVRARFASWYELFPRSMSDDPARHGTFDDVIRKLPYVRDMGFDVLYFPPIHPIGSAFRKGKNNALVAQDGDPGSPYAIGAAEGGHKAIHPQLGTLEDFRRLIAAATEHGLEIALDYAIQVSPDHPYVSEHPDWFFIRPDGTIKYAENPPKKYQDIYPLNFYGEGWEEQWEEWKSIFLFWVEQGVKIFRVDNPHTKPVQFWEWAIRDIQRDHPDVIFLSEAFTRPKMMRVLAKVGFTQSYTYFTWRKYKGELEEYFTELTQSEMREYYRGNLFANTPDINPEFLQTGGPPAFMIRATLAATLSPLYGIYSGFELCEGTPLPGREEYLDSEKYEIKAWDWDRPGNIRSFITRLNTLRRTNPALQEYDNLHFHLCDDEQVLFYEKALGDNLLFVAVSLDPFAARSVTLFFPMPTMGIAEDEAWQAEELLTGERYFWRGSHQHVRLEPSSPARIWRVRRPHRDERESLPEPRVADIR
jgi:starch synthase (maltosyl-transferring)